MNYEKRFLEIKSFLKKHNYLVDQEMLDRFESPIPNPYKRWIQELSNAPQDKLIELENSYETDFIKDDDLLTFILESRRLILVDDFLPSDVELPKEITRKMSLKKRHEITRIKDLLKHEDISNFVDIGSGAGHLSSALVNENRSSLCIDANRDYQLIGKEKIKRWTPFLKDKITFVQKSIHSEADIIMPKGNGMLLGLHCCGPLSTSIIKSLPQRLLSLGCCYHKLKDEYNISTLAKDSPFQLTNHALNCAAKGYTWHTHKSFQEKINVKMYRYTLHFLLLEKFNQEFISVGNAKEADYNGSFANYCYKYAPQTKSLNISTIDSFYQDNTRKVYSIIAAGSLRALLARIIEMYIILDRVIFLKENGRNPKLIEIFDQKISPRNLAIYI